MGAQDATQPTLVNASVYVSVQVDDFDLDTQVRALQTDPARAAGAIASFVGLVRPWGGQGEPSESGAAGGQWLELEHYPGMTERSLMHMAQTAATQFGALGVRIVHRVGRLAVGEQIVLVAVSAAHRRAAFECCECLMDWLKTQAPFWKREISEGTARWVDAREQDDAALARWGVALGAPAQGGAA